MSCSTTKPARAAKRLLLVVVLLGAVTTAWARPAQVILLRHAEKPLDDSNPHLSARGLERAQAFSLFLATNTVFLTHGPPVALFAAKPTGGRPSRRPAETLAPLGARLKLPVQMPHASRDHAALARHILSNPAYEGKTVVVCWVNDFLPDLARDFGAAPKPKNWESDNYDRIWLLTFGGSKVSLKSLSQRLAPEAAGK